MTVSGAYGRDYRSAKAARADWNAGKDFIVQDFSSPWCGKPVNKEQAQGEAVMIRYAGMRKVCQA